MITNYETSLEKLREFFEDSLSELNIPELIFIDTNVTANYLNGLIINNNNLKKINFPNLEQQPYYLITKNLQEINLNSLKRIEFGLLNLNSSSLYTHFLQNTKIRKLELPNFIGTASANTALPPGGTNINADNANSASFWNNYWLSDVSLGNSKMKEINNNYFNGFWFRNNYFLTSLRLNYPYVIKLVKGTLGFNTTPIGAGNGYIYVPDNLLDNYKQADGWSQIGNKIKGMSSYEVDRAIVKDSLEEVSWNTILSDCNRKNTNNYKIGDTKTIFIKGIPIQMVIVDKNTDFLNDSETAQLSWLGKTISIFDTINTYEIYDSLKLPQYKNALSFKNQLNDIFNNIDNIDEQSILKQTNGIKTVIKNSYGFDSAGNGRYITSEEKIWVPSAYEIGLAATAGGLRRYSYFSTSNPAKYTVGATNLINLNNENISFALRDITNSSSNYLDIARATTSGSSPMEVVAGSSQQPYLVFGFCT